MTYEEISARHSAKFTNMMRTATELHVQLIEMMKSIHDNREYEDAVEYLYTSSNGKAAYTYTSSEF